MKISYDPGHYSVSAYNGIDLKNFLAVLGEPWADTMQMSIPGEAQRQKNSTGRQEIISEFGHWFVGKTALKQSGNLTYGRDEGWAYTNAYRSLMLFTVSQFFAPETNSGVVDLVMGLPIQDYKNNRAKLKTMFERNYKIDRSKYSKQRDLSLFVRSVLFLPQGVAPARAYLEAGKMIVCLDLGSRNINYITVDITDGHPDLLERLSRSREAGATATINSIIADIADLTGREFSIPQIVRLIESSEDSIFSGNKKFDVRNILDHHLDSYRDKILTIISNIWGEAKDIDQFIIFGGGDYLAGEAIAQKYPGQVVRLDKPLHATVKSQWDYLAKKGG